MGKRTALERARLSGWILIGLQFAGMIAFSTVKYSRYALTQDFGIYSQAWWAIGHGNLDPRSSFIGIAFWRNNAEFIMWPLALLYHLDPHPLLLLWVQDAAVAATEVVTLAWILDVIDRRQPQVPERFGVGLAVGAVVVMLLDPWCYATIAFDFHLEVFAALSATLAGWDLWAGRTRRMWAWVPLALASDTIGALCVLGVGLSGILAGRKTGRKTRRHGVLVAAAGLAWVLVMGAIGGAGVGGRVTRAGYAYLTGRHSGHSGLTSIATGVLLHPAVVLHLLLLRGPTVLLFLLTVGLVGVISPWGFGPALMVFAPSTLFVNGVYLRPGEAFQSWPALSFVLVGSVMVVLRLTSAGAAARRASVVAACVWCAACIVFALYAFAPLRKGIAVDARVAAVLAHAQRQIPASAEVIASQRVVGRFADRHSAHPFPYYNVLGRPTRTFRVSSRLVVFVFTQRLGVRFVRYTLHARLLDARDGVHVLAWSPPPSTTRITLP